VAHPRNLQPRGEARDVIRRRGGSLGGQAHDGIAQRPEDALALSRLRWSVERLFLDLKETLDRHCLYAAHPNLVAQQVYAAAIVHTAFRVAQAGIAKQARVLPEPLSPAKLFP